MTAIQGSAAASLASVTPEPVDHNFVDFDKPSVFKWIESEAALESCQNFVVEFGHEHAQIACNLKVHDFKDLYKKPRVAEYPIRWMSVTFHPTLLPSGTWKAATSGRLQLTRHSLQ